MRQIPTFQARSIHFTLMEAINSKIQDPKLEFSENEVMAVLFVQGIKLEKDTLRYHL